VLAVTADGKVRAARRVRPADVCRGNKARGRRPAALRCDTGKGIRGRARVMARTHPIAAARARETQARARETDGMCAESRR
jgi:hypothetical protein